MTSIVVGLADEVGVEIPLVELHPLDELQGGGRGFPLFDGDHAIAADSFHGIGQHVADRRVVVRRDRADLAISSFFETGRESVVVSSVTAASTAFSIPRSHGRRVVPAVMF